MTALASPRIAVDETPTVLVVPEEGGGRGKRPDPVSVKVAMYFAVDGTLHHTRCRTRLQLRGVRAKLEADFWCSSCHEHVTLTTYAATQIPVEADASRDDVVKLVK